MKTLAELLEFAKASLEATVMQFQTRDRKYFSHIT